MQFDTDATSPTENTIQHEHGRHDVISQCRHDYCLGWSTGDELAVGAGASSPGVSSGGGALLSRFRFWSSHLSISSLRLANGRGPRSLIMSSLYNFVNKDPHTQTDGKRTG